MLQTGSDRLSDGSLMIQYCQGFKTSNHSTIRDARWIFNHSPLGLVKLVHVFKTDLPPLNKEWNLLHAMPGQPHPNPPHQLALCSWPMPTPTPPTGRCSNSFIVNLLLYGWFITKGFSLSCPLLMRRARRLSCPTSSSHRNTKGGTTCATDTTDTLHDVTAVSMVTVGRVFVLYRGSKGSAYAYCQFI